MLLLIGDAGTVTVQNDLIIGFANDFLSPARGLDRDARVGRRLRARRVRDATDRRTKTGLPNEPVSVMVLKVAFLAAVGTVVVAVANQDRGVPYVGVLLIALLHRSDVRRRPDHSSAATSTRSAATRRPPAAPASTSTGITIAVFAICSTMAGARRHRARLAPALGRHRTPAAARSCSTRSRRRSSAARASSAAAARSAARCSARS